MEGETLAKITGTESRSPSVVRIYGPSSILRARIIPAVSNALQPFGNVTFSFQLSDTESGVDALKLGNADFAVMEPDAIVNEFSSKKLRSERYILVGPSQWKSRSLADVIETERIVDFDPTDQMTFRLLTAHGLRELARTDRYFINNTDALASLVIEGFAYSVLSQDLDYFIQL